MNSLKISIILLGDAIVFYASLLLTLFFRFSKDSFSQAVADHLIPFSFVLAIWVFVFYLADLYQMRTLKDKRFFWKNFLPAVVISSTASVIFFYILVPFFKISPKTNLFLFAVFFTFLDYGWRYFFIRFLSSGFKTKVLLAGGGKSALETFHFLKSNPQFGYEPVLWKKGASKEEIKDLLNFIAASKIEKIVIPSSWGKEKDFISSVYKMLSLEVEVVFSHGFYEDIFQKVPLEEIDERWLIEKIKIGQKAYDSFRRAVDIFLSPLLMAVFSPVFLIGAILIKIDSRGPVIYKQKRTGKDGKPFTLYKLRTMRIDKPGPLWTEEGDGRVTAVGNVFRTSHLDEIPQLFNILKGDISFVGPRAESLELAGMYKKLPYYGIRHIIKPGLTGWAQINYKPSTSLQEADEKLRYDIYYIKNRSLALDILIILRTVRLLFVSPK